MKLRNRDINIFSMSALDLFASGMGAFILLTVMALPFFPNTGDSPKLIEQLQAERDAATRRAASLAAALSKLQQSSDAQQALNEALSEALGKLQDAQSKVAELEKLLAEERAKPEPPQPEPPQPAPQIDPSRVRELEQALERAKQQRDAAEQATRELEDAIKKIRMPDLDIVICLDVTASMTDQIDGLKREVATLAQVLDSLAPSAGIGVVAFGDRLWRQPIHEQPIVETTRLGILRAFVDSLRPNMDPQSRRNQDGPEAAATALDRAVAMNWRSVSKRRYVIVITDNAAYPDRIAHALATAQLFGSVEGHFVSAVRANFAQGRREREAADRFLRDLAVAGNGQFVDAAGGESIMGNILLAILDT